ncbi:hypothetical protein [Nocardia sp. NPDC052566]|uniref:hypothetical protein n=1 Tax=Nocardia sp. NPDC052566 TaxID=3364330 RepID=UPI0037CC06F5
MKAKGSPQRVVVPFAAALSTALEIAATSPSSHNCQPWAVARLTSDLARRRAGALLGADVDDGPEYLVLAANRGRELTALPAHHTEMRLSCGLYWRLLLRAMAAQGWAARGAVTPPIAQLRELGIPAEWIPLRLTGFHWIGEQDEDLAELRVVAAGRHTNRGPFDERPVDAFTLAGLLRHGIGADGPILIRYLTSEYERNRFADFVKRHGGRDFAHRAAWRETYSYIRRSADEAARRGDGFTFTHLFGQLSPAQLLLRRLVLAPNAMTALRVIGFPRILAGQLAAMVRRAPAIVVLSLPSSSYQDEDVIAAGERLCDYWLQATRAGLVLHPVSIVVQHDDLRAGLRAAFGFTGRPFFVARLGYPTARFPRSPRRDPHASFRVL